MKNLTRYKSQFSQRGKSTVEQQQQQQQNRFANSNCCSSQVNGRSRRHWQPANPLAMSLRRLGMQLVPAYLPSNMRSWTGWLLCLSLSLWPAPCRCRWRGKSRGVVSWLSDRFKVCCLLLFVELRVKFKTVITPQSLTPPTPRLASHAPCCKENTCRQAGRQAGTLPVSLMFLV